MKAMLDDQFDPGLPCDVGDHEIVWPAADPDAPPLVFHRSNIHNVAPVGEL